MLAAIADISQEAGGSESLARDTGGFSVTKSNELEPGILRIATESRSYYLLGYGPGNIPRDGRFRKIEVRVKRPRRDRARPPRLLRADTTGRDGDPEGDAPRDPQIQYGLDAPTPLDGIALRMTTTCSTRRRSGARACCSRRTPTSPRWSPPARASCSARWTRSR